MLVDSHCHLDFEALAGDRAAVLARAGAAGVGAMLTIGTRRNNATVVQGIAEEHPNIWCSVGIHPHEAGNDHLTTVELVALSGHPRTIGIGETGLDFYYDRAGREQQGASFRAHCAAARETGLPLIVHSRDADEETARILRDEASGGGLGGVLHCFSSGWELAKTALDLGFYVSISGIVTFKNAEPLREIVRRLPLDRLLVETDAPYLAPVPMRGRPNEPAYLTHTAARVAELKDLSPATLAEASTSNFFRLFTKARRPSAAGTPRTA
ncbi:MAG: TatD family deoxyribonuclease [Alphaproteobacteria bacterium]|nr:TatD family deoxyribonuclease [Alphaproteobacteria bacterium]